MVTLELNSGGNSIKENCRKRLREDLSQDEEEEGCEEDIRDGSERVRRSQGYDHLSEGMHVDEWKGFRREGSEQFNRSRSATLCSSDDSVRAHEVDDEEMEPRERGEEITVEKELLEQAEYAERQYEEEQLKMKRVSEELTAKGVDEEEEERASHDLTSDLDPSEQPSSRSRKGKEKEPISSPRSPEEEEMTEQRPRSVTAVASSPALLAAVAGPSETLTATRLRNKTIASRPNHPPPRREKTQAEQWIEEELANAEKEKNDIVQEMLALVGLTEDTMKQNVDKYIKEAEAWFAKQRSLPDEEKRRIQQEAEQDLAKELEKIKLRDLPKVQRPIQRPSRTGPEKAVFVEMCRRLASKEIREEMQAFEERYHKAEMKKFAAEWSMWVNTERDAKRSR